jgi:CBS domain-containing protein
MRVADLMQREVTTISVDATVADAVAMLAATRLSAVPVVDRFGRAVGVVSTREVLEAESRCDSPAARERLFGRTLVLEIMAPWPVTISPDADVADAARCMVRVGQQRLFVEGQGRLAGVISQTDVVGAVAAARV